MENQKHFGDNLIAALKEAASELEGYQLQAALGKAEAKVKAGEIEHKLKDIIKKAKDRINTGESKFEKLKGKLEHLEVQLALGKAEAKEAIEGQKKKIAQVIRDIEDFYSKL